MLNEVTTIPARRGIAARLRQGQSIKVINIHGTQVVDFWAVNSHDTREFLSMEHLRASTQRMIPKPGDGLVTNRRRAILHFVEDSSPGIHDTLMAACDTHRYALLGCTDYHDNCTDNFFAALHALGISMGECPSPLNLWMNIPWNSEGALDWDRPTCKAGDHVVLRAEIDCIAVMSACPQDILPVNDHKTLDAAFQILNEG